MQLAAFAQSEAHLPPHCLSVTDMIEIASAPPLTAALITAVMSYTLVLSAVVTAKLSQARVLTQLLKTSASVLTWGHKCSWADVNQRLI